MGKRIICLCNLVYEKEIINTLKKGAKSTKDIQNLTRAGTGCGRCLVVIDSIVDEFLTNQPINPQQKLDFD